jgi:hypothetical protein
MALKSGLGLACRPAGAARFYYLAADAPESNGKNVMGGFSRAYGSAEDQHTPKGSERKVVPGVNIPSSAEQLKEELGSAGRGAAGFVERSAKSLASKARDYVDSTKRAIGLKTGDRKPLSDDVIHGGAGKMQQGSATGFR